jgi:polyferredoxin
VSKGIDIDLLGPTGDPGGDSLYVSERKVYPRDVSGRFDRLRKLAVFWLLGMYYVFPWLQWDGRQAVLFDLPARKFHVFGLTFWPQDFSLLAILLVILALVLFFATALAGRLWCGYACPQTVWTETFLWMERWTEGDRQKRMKLDAGPWTREKLLRKGAKHALWLVFALWTGFTFVGFFTPITSLGARLWPFAWNGTETFWVLFYALATWGNAGILREQVCKYMCPYARFQSAMFDHDTLVISYDTARGEPRGARKRSVPSVLSRSEIGDRRSGSVEIGDRRSEIGESSAAGSTQALPRSPISDLRSPSLGDCLDCAACVQACPTGIDIRDGLQIECIACAACIDACDAVMDKMNYPRGLIRYTTENMLTGRGRHVLRPRTAIYAALLAAMLAAFGWGITHRAPLIVEVLHDRNALWRESADGTIENGYTVKLVNKTDRMQHLRIAVEDEGDDDEGQLHGHAEVDVPAGEVASVPLTLHGRRDEVHGRHHVELRARNADGSIDIERKTQFFAPEKPHDHD